jgi:hypothetical protein
VASWRRNGGGGGGPVERLMDEEGALGAASDDGGVCPATAQAWRRRATVGQHRGAVECRGSDRWAVGTVKGGGGFLLV